MGKLSFIQLIAVWILPVLFAITVHEVAHGWVANRLGDKTALMLGRITLNPLKHIDPVGTILVPGLLLFLSSGFIFGWAKPVPVNWNNLRHPKRDMALVALAGPVSNFMMALLWAGVLKLGIALSQQGQAVGVPLGYMGQAGILINLVLMVLNLIPVPPLDGSRVVSSLLPPKLNFWYERIEPFGFFILLGLLMLGLLGQVLGPPVLWLRHWILALVS